MLSTSGFQSRLNIRNASRGCGGDGTVDLRLRRNLWATITLSPSELADGRLEVVLPPVVVAE